MVTGLAVNFTLFLTQGTGNFAGSAAFSEQMKKLIGDAADLKVGRLVMQQLLEMGKQFTIVEGKSKSITGGNEINVENGVISLNFTGRQYYAAPNGNGERELFEIPQVSMLIHELIHTKHRLTDAEALKSRVIAQSTIKDMHSEEEEFTITGRVIGTDETDPCNEHALHGELGIPPRLDHLFYSQTNDENAFVELIYSRAIVNLRQRLSTDEGLKEFLTSEERLLQIAVSEMIGRDVDEGKQESAAIVDLLLRKGCKSDKALETLIGRSVPEYFPMVQTLLQAGSKSNGALTKAIRAMGAAADSEKRVSYFDMSLRFIQAGCQSDYALETTADIASKNLNQDLQQRLFIIFHQLKESGCQLKDRLFPLVEMINKTPLLWDKILWSKMIEPWVVERLHRFAGELEKEFIYYMELLLKNSYEPIWLQLFEMSQDLSSEKRQCERHLNWMHHYLNRKSSLDDVKNALCRRLSDDPVKRITELDELLHAVFYIAVSAQSFFKEAPGEAYDQFEKQMKLFKSILLHHESRDHVKSKLLNTRMVALATLKINYL